METDRRESEGVESAGAGLAHAQREAGDGLSQSPAFAEPESLLRDGSYLTRSSSRSPSNVKEPSQEYKLSKDEFEFTKDYLNKEFRRYQQPNIDIDDLYDDRPRLSATETERLKRSLFGEELPVPTPDYLVKNSEFLQRSNEFLSRLARERSRKDGGRDAESRLLADYREILRDYGDEASLPARGRFDDGAERLRQEIERFRHDKAAYSTSEDEAPRLPEDVQSYSKGVHHLLAGYPGRRPESDTEGEGSESATVGDSSAMYHHPLQHSPNLNLRQNSPYPAEGLNQGKHKQQHYSHKKTSLRNNEKNDKLSNSHRDGSAGLGSREHSSGTLASRGRMSSRRHAQNNGLHSSSSNSSLSDNADTYHDVDPRARMGIDNDVSGVDSPPEPAPPEVPPRGPSLHHPGGGHTLGRGGRAAQERQDIFLSQEYLMSGSPRSYPTKGAKSPNNGVGPNQELLHCERDMGLSKDGTLAAQNRMTAGVGNSPQIHVTPATPIVMPVFPLRAPPTGYSPYSPSRFQIDKRCQHRCSWKCFSIALILVTLVLTALLAYFGTVSSMKSGLDASSCILVEDAKAVSQDGADHVISSQSPTEESVSTSTTANQHLAHFPVDPHTQSTLNEPLVKQQQLQSHQQLPSFSNYWPTVTEFGVSYKSKVSPYQFWNLELKNKQPAFIRLNFTLPWGSNFAVYGRRNVAPTVTQHDFVEFVKGGRLDRLKRDAVDFIEYRSKRDLHSVVFIKQGGNGTSAKNVTKRSSGTVTSDAPAALMVNVSLLQYLDTGNWFVSVYNDDVRPHEVSLIVTEAEGVSTACPNDCSSHGSCYLGKCDCIDGFEGVDCSKSVCPVLCSNHGKYGGGVCHCEEGWKGPECDVPTHDCQVPDCSGHGKCNNGNCECQLGWKGLFCSEVDCLDPTCSEHGTCVSGKCYCKAGWQGANCSLLDKQVYQCLPSCSEHGSYDQETGMCKCQPFWTGSDCSKALCSLDCGPHGRCRQGKCECVEGWTGDKCDLLPCDSRCLEHGQCKNGTCVCFQGWNGLHCTLPGCVNACSRHGMCSLEDGEYHCICSEQWAGDDCSIPLEQECNDELDNDQDGMVDCSDSECCSHPSCADHIMCLSSNDPVEVLLRKQPPSVTASFYQRVKFLIEEKSVQSYAHMDEYSESRVSVMRGRVVTPQGLGIVGIRVSVDKDSRFGFTLTRNGGWYDVLVNGGGAVTLQFQRSPFKPLTKTVFVPWNQIVVLPPVQMSLGDPAVDDSAKSTRNITLPPDYFSQRGIYFENTVSFLPLDTCLDHSDLRPVIVSSWAPEKRGAMSDQSLVLADSQMVQERIGIPGSDLSLMYQSSQGAGYLSLLYMRLSGSSIPATLTHVHVRVEIEGSVYTKMYESDPYLTHIFAWNKRNVYKQKVYGLAQAKISIGYQYSTCGSVIWETQTATMEGFTVDISDIGGWSLDVHHHYNFHEGILQKGDGTTVHLKSYPRAVKVLMGTGLQRSLKCTDCNGPAKDAKLLTPVALASGPDGSLYVGDFNLVRRVTPDGNVYTVYQLSATQVSYQYFLTISPADGKLYISNPESHQVLRVLILDPVQEPALNGDVVVGSGERCIPGDLSNCGDGGPAKLAKLTHPKGLAIAADRTMYIADGTNIRAVDENDNIHTLIGHHGHNNHWQPIPCKSAIPANQAQLQWPSGLALSPLDGSLYFIDDRLVLKLTADLKIKVVAGSALHCQAKNGTSDPTDDLDPLAEDVPARGSVLGALLALAFSPTGDLYLAQSDSRKANSIKVVDSAGRISDFAGKPTLTERSEGCECRNGTGMKDPCCDVPVDDSSNKETLLSSNARLSQISAIAVGPDGVVYAADQGSLHILSLEHYLPVHDENGEFQIPYPALSEMYVFNRYGQHTETRDLTSGLSRYRFLYSKNTSFGKLSTVTDASGNKILFLRDYSNVVSTIENTQDHKSDLKISGVGFLVKFSQKGKTDVDLDYDSATGLLTSRSDSTGGGGGQSLIYRYDKYGRVTSVILPTGEVMTLTARLSPSNKLEVTVTGLNDRVTTLTMDGVGAKRLSATQGVTSTECVSYRNGSMMTSTSWGGSFHSAAVAKFPLLELSLPIEAEMLPMWSYQKTQLGDSVNEMEWRYSLSGDINSKTKQTVLREIHVNRTRVLTVELDQAMSKESYYNMDGEKLLTVSYNGAGLPLSWVPHFGHPVNVTYDRFNRLESWTWGKRTETYAYERHGLLSTVTFTPQEGPLGLSYNELNMLSKLSMPSGRVFQLSYDTEGGLRFITLPSGTKHGFSCQPSLGFIRATYTPPGSVRPYIQHYSSGGALLQTVYPGDGARVVYRYHNAGLLSEVVHGDGKSEILYSGNHPTAVLHSERELEYKWDLTHAGGLLVEERVDFGSKTGLSNAKISYAYDDNFRPSLISGRIGGQNLPELVMEYSAKTGGVVQIGQFQVSQPPANETTVSDGTALFSRRVNEYFQNTQVAVTIHRMEVFRMEFAYDLRGRISQTRTYTRNVGVNTYTNTKNYTWDADGQLTGVDAQEPWGFKYDANGNMLALNYRGNTIPMEYNVMDRIVKFGEGQYKYDSRGMVIQNAREERFHYNAKGMLVRATKRGRFDVRYYYDHLDRLAARKDNYGNVTQFFYTNHQRPHEVSYIYSPRDGKLMPLVYDDRGHLIYAQVHRHKYYIATDQCGTPVMVFNQYGEGIREIMRSPYGHIVYDSNPYIYLPVDFCGGLLDQVTSLVHMPNGQVYDPLIGQWMTPNWESILHRVASPNHLHLYRFNGNDPINVHAKKIRLTDHSSWFELLGYRTRSLLPQLHPSDSPHASSHLGPGAGGSLSPRGLLDEAHFAASAFTTASGFLASAAERKSSVWDLSSLRSSRVRQPSILAGWESVFAVGRPGASSEPPFGKGILVTRLPGGMAVLNSVPTANPIYKDVFTSVFNRSFLLDLRFLVHGVQQDAFYFVKPDTWRASDDRGQLKRLGSQVNTSFHEKDQEMADIKIHNSGTVINLRYGTTPEKEKNRLLHHAKGQALRKAWHRERDLLRLGFPGSLDWAQTDQDEILKLGYSLAFDGEYVRDIERYPELAEDPFNIRFVKKDNYKAARKRRRRSVVTTSAPAPVRMLTRPPPPAHLNRVLSQVRADNTKNVPVDFIRTNATYVKRKATIRKCKIWWLSWEESC